MIVLHDHEMSAECYAVRLFAGVVGVDYTRRLVDWRPGRETEGDAFLALNPLGELPVLEVDGAPITDWIAILAFLAGRFDPGWFPTAQAHELARVGEALGLARRLGETLGALRRHDLFGDDGAELGDVEQRRVAAHRLLRALDSRLWFLEEEGCDWLAGGARASIGDLAVFVHVVFSEDAGVGREDYPAVRRWLDRIRRLGRFVAMGGVAALPELVAPAQLAR